MLIYIHGDIYIKIPKNLGGDREPKTSMFGVQRGTRGYIRRILDLNDAEKNRIISDSQ